MREFGPQKTTHPGYKDERHDICKTKTQERVFVLKRCVNWHEIVHNGGFQGTTCRQLQDIFSPQAIKLHPMHKHKLLWLLYYSSPQKRQTII